MTMQGKTVVVTGGFGALGSAVAEGAIQRGASVAALDYAPAAPAGLAERLGPKALIVVSTSPCRMRRSGRWPR